MEEEPAVEEAVNRCIEEGHMEEYLRSHLGEVKEMLLSGFDEEIWKEGLREEGREEGRVEGRVEERRTMISDMLQRGREPKSISEFCNIPLDEVLNVQKSLVATK